MADLDAARSAKAVQHVMNATGTHSHPVYVVGVNAGHFMGQMLKATETQMPTRFLREAKLKIETLPSIHQNIKCFAPQVSSLQDVEPIENDESLKGLRLKSDQRRLKIKTESDSAVFMEEDADVDLSEDPLGDCLKRNGWGASQVDAMSLQVKKGFVSRKVAKARGVSQEPLLEMGEYALGELCPQGNEEVAPVNAALAGPMVNAMQKTKQINKDERLDGLTLPKCLMMTGWSEQKVDAMTKDVQRKFVAKKVSLERNVPVKQLEMYSDDELASMCPLAKKDNSATQVKLVTRLMKDRTYPPTIFAHMPRNSIGEVDIAKSMCQLKQQNVRTAEVQSYPKRVSALNLVAHGFSEANAHLIMDAWKGKDILNENGFFVENPTQPNAEWRTALLPIQHEIGGVDEDVSAIDDVVRSLYAESNMISDHTSKILDFCEGKELKDDDDHSLKLHQRFQLNSQCKLTQASIQNV